MASLYSGTLGACIEGTVYEIPSIGFSLCTHKPHPDFSPVLKYAGTIIEKFLEFPPDKDTYLNVNFPAIPADEILGIRMARRGRGRWVEEFDTHYDENDHWLVYHKYITVVPHRVDTTDYAEMERLGRAWGL